MMAKVTISDFIVALADLLEAESRALRESTALFMAEQRALWEESLLRSGWRMAWMTLFVLFLAAAFGFGAWGFYLWLGTRLSPPAAAWATGGLFLAAAALFGWLAAGGRR